MRNGASPAAVSVVDPLTFPPLGSSVMSLPCIWRNVIKNIHSHIAFTLRTEQLKRNSFLIVVSCSPMVVHLNCFYPTDMGNRAEVSFCTLAVRKLSSVCGLSIVVVIMRSIRVCIIILLNSIPLQACFFF